MNKYNFYFVTSLSVIHTIVVTFYYRNWSLSYILSTSSKHQVLMLSKKKLLKFYKNNLLTLQAIVHFVSSVEDDVSCCLQSWQDPLPYVVPPIVWLATISFFFFFCAFGLRCCCLVSCSSWWWMVVTWRRSPKIISVHFDPEKKKSMCRVSCVNAHCWGSQFPRTIRLSPIKTLVAFWNCVRLMFD